MVGTARTASEQISGILKQIQVKVVQADGADTNSLAKLQAERLSALTDAITSIATSAQCNGVNPVSSPSRVLERNRVRGPGQRAARSRCSRPTPCRCRCAPT